ncbi:unnamed protein product [Closterium sp. Yama58-4]|nr:unnamed protein product [Closterium sp. Yama58-4]
MAAGSSCVNTLLLMLPLLAVVAVGKTSHGDGGSTIQLQQQHDHSGLEPTSTAIKLRGGVASSGRLLASSNPPAAASSGRLLASSNRPAAASSGRLLASSNPPAAASSGRLLASSNPPAAASSGRLLASSNPPAPRPSTNSSPSSPSQRKSQSPPRSPPSAAAAIDSLSRAPPCPSECPSGYVLEPVASGLVDDLYGTVLVLLDDVPDTVTDTDGAAQGGAGGKGDRRTGGNGGAGEESGEDEDDREVGNGRGGGDVDEGEVKKRSCKCVEPFLLSLQFKICSSNITLSPLLNPAISSPPGRPAPVPPSPPSSSGPPHAPDKRAADGGTDAFFPWFKPKGRNGRNDLPRSQQDEDDDDQSLSYQGDRQGRAGQQGGDAAGRGSAPPAAMPLNLPELEFHCLPLLLPPSPPLSTPPSRNPPATEAVRNATTAAVAKLFTPPALARFAGSLMVLPARNIPATAVAVTPRGLTGVVLKIFPRPGFEGFLPEEEEAMWENLAAIGRGVFDQDVRPWGSGAVRDGSEGFRNGTSGRKHRRSDSASSSGGKGGGKLFAANLRVFGGKGLNGGAGKLNGFRKAFGSKAFARLVPDPEAILAAGALDISYTAIEAATHRFSEKNLLGRGTFGRVYKATLPNGLRLAIKRLDLFVAGGDVGRAGGAGGGRRSGQAGVVSREAARKLFVQQVGGLSLVVRDDLACFVAVSHALNWRTTLCRDGVSAQWATKSPFSRIAAPLYSSATPPFLLPPKQVEALSLMRCPHVVPLLGYSTDGVSAVLAYEFVPNGSLHDHLHGSGRLDWAHRVKIAVAVARGLQSLHQRLVPIGPASPLSPHHEATAARDPAHGHPAAATGQSASSTSPYTTNPGYSSNPTARITPSDTSSEPLQSSAYASPHSSLPSSLGGSPHKLDTLQESPLEGEGDGEGEGYGDGEEEFLVSVGQGNGPSDSDSYSSSGEFEGGVGGGVVHANLKSANVLLDNSGNAKVTDYCLSRLAEDALPTRRGGRATGTFGYLAPEGVLFGVNTQRSDVYSFGVILLELITGRRPIDLSKRPDEQSLVSWAVPLIDKDETLAIADPALRNRFPPTSFHHLATVAAVCVQSEPSFRPTMTQVLGSLVPLIDLAEQWKSQGKPHAGPLKSASPPSSGLAENDSNDSGDDDPLPVGVSALDWAFNMLRWCPASDLELRSCECRLLSFVRTPHRVIQIDIGHPPAVRKKATVWPSDKPLEDTLSWGWQKAAETDGGSGGAGGGDAAENCFINTLVVGATTCRGDGRGDEEEVNGKPNLVMIHGYAAALGFFFRNYDALAEHFNVYSIDQLGWGASSRPTFTPASPEEAETWFVEALEAWRREMGLRRFVLLGHSFGGFVASRYALKYPSRVRHLVLVGPAGFSHESAKMQQFRSTWKGFAFQCYWDTNIPPQQFIRWLGPWSRDIVKSATTQRWSDLPTPQENMTPEQVDAFCDYIYQTLSAPMSGEQCMKFIFSLGAFARRPLIDSAVHWKAPTTFIYGEQDIMDHRAGLAAAKQMPVPAEVFNVREMPSVDNTQPAIFASPLHHILGLISSCSTVDAAWKHVEPHHIPLTTCHKIHLDMTSTVLIAPQGNSDRAGSRSDVGSAMEGNRDEAQKAKGLAETKLLAGDVAGARRFWEKASRMYASLDGLSQMQAVLDVHEAVAKRLPGVGQGEVDWYLVLDVPDFCDDDALIKKSYRKKALLLHPDKNKGAGAETAFKYVSEAFGCLSDKVKKSQFDLRKRARAAIGARGGHHSAAGAAAAAAASRHHTAANRQHGGSGRGHGAGGGSSGAKGGAAAGGAAAPQFYTRCHHCCASLLCKQDSRGQIVKCLLCEKMFLALEQPQAQGSLFERFCSPGPAASGFRQAFVNDVWDKVQRERMEEQAEGRRRDRERKEAEVAERKRVAKAARDAERERKKAAAAEKAAAVVAAAVAAMGAGAGREGGGGQTKGMAGEAVGGEGMGAPGAGAGGVGVAGDAGGGEAGGEGRSTRKRQRGREGKEDVLLGDMSAAVHAAMAAARAALGTGAMNGPGQVWAVFTDRVLLQQRRNGAGSGGGSGVGLGEGLDRYDMVQVAREGEVKGGVAAVVGAAGLIGLPERPEDGVRGQVVVWLLRRMEGYTSIFQLAVVVAVLAALLVGAVAEEQEFLPGQPKESVRGSGGRVETWSEDFKQLQAAEVGAAMITVESQSLALPSYSDSGQVGYVLSGEAMAGLLSPMGAPTTVRRLREGDAFVIPRGWARWVWNNGQQPLRIVSLADTSKGPCPCRYTPFHLMGAQKERFGGVLHGFRRSESEAFCMASVNFPARHVLVYQFSPRTPFRAPFSRDLLAQAWDVEEKDVQQLLEAQKETSFVKVTPRLRAELEQLVNRLEQAEVLDEEEIEENDQPHFGKGAKRSVSIFADFTYNLKARQPDIYMKRGGTVTSASGYKLPAFRKVGFAVARFSLEGNAMTAPKWLANAAAMLYVTKGKGRVEIAYPDGKQALRHDVKEGDFVVVPASFPHAALAYGEGLEAIAMIPKSRPQPGFLAGANSVFRMLPPAVQRAAFNADEKLLEKLRATRQSEFGILPPRKSKGETEEEGEEMPMLIEQVVGF